MRLDTDISATTDDRILNSRDGFVWMNVVSWLGKAGELTKDDRNQFLW